MLALSDELSDCPDFADLDSAAKILSLAEYKLAEGNR
jgi:hypothetical protein